MTSVSLLRNRTNSPRAARAPSLLMREKLNAPGALTRRCARAPEVLERLGFHAVVVDDHDLVGRVAGAALDAVNALPQQGQPIARGDDDADERPALDRPGHPQARRPGVVHHLRRLAGGGKVLNQRAPSRLDGSRRDQCDARRGGATVDGRVGTPDGRAGAERREQKPVVFGRERLCGPATKRRDRRPTDCAEPSDVRKREQQLRRPLGLCQVGLVPVDDVGLPFGIRRHDGPDGVGQELVAGADDGDQRCARGCRRCGEPLRRITAAGKGNDSAIAGQDCAISLGAVADEQQLPVGIALRIQRGDRDVDRCAGTVVNQKQECETRWARRCPSAHAAPEGAKVLVPPRSRRRQTPLDAPQTGSKHDRQNRTGSIT